MLSEVPAALSSWDPCELGSPVGEVCVYTPCSLVSLGSALPGIALMDARAPGKAGCVEAPFRALALTSQRQMWLL